MYIRLACSHCRRPLKSNREHCVGPEWEASTSQLAECFLFTCSKHLCEEMTSSPKKIPEINFRTGLGSLEADFLVLRDPFWGPFEALKPLQALPGCPERPRERFRGPPGRVTSPPGTPSSPPGPSKTNESLNENNDFAKNWLSRPR